VAAELSEHFLERHVLNGKVKRTEKSMIVSIVKAIEVTEEAE